MARLWSAKGTLVPNEAGSLYISDGGPGFVVPEPLSEYYGDLVTAGRLTTLNPEAQGEPIPAPPSSGVGPTGATGPSGPAPWQSPPVDWTMGAQYTATAPASLVRYNGSVWVCTTSHTAGEGFVEDNFALVVADGATGPSGAPGATGATGASGASGLQWTVLYSSEWSALPTAALSGFNGSFSIGGAAVVIRNSSYSDVTAGLGVTIRGGLNSTPQLSLPHLTIDLSQFAGYDPAAQHLVLFRANGVVGNSDGKALFGFCGTTDSNVVLDGLHLVGMTQPAGSKKVTVVPYGENIASFTRAEAANNPYPTLSDAVYSVHKTAVASYLAGYSGWTGTMPSTHTGSTIVRQSNISNNISHGYQKLNAMAMVSDGGLSGATQVYISHVSLLQRG